MSSRPNVVVVYTDDQRFDTIGALGAPIETPNLDRIVERGIAFTHAHIPGGMVGAICMPSRAMLHTGRTLFHLEDQGSTIPEDHTLLGEHLQSHGYRSWGTGKWHNGPRAFNRSFGDGDEIFYGGMNDHWNVPANHYDPSGRYETRLPITPNWFTSRDLIMRQADHVIPGKHSSELFVDAALDHLRGCDTTDPFFMYVAFMAPHDPRTMPQKYLRMYDPARIDLPESFCSEHPFDIGVRAGRDEMLAPYPRTEEEIRVHIAEYYAMITHLDAELGRVLDELDRQGLTNDTIIVMAGDNGLAVGRHGLMGKQNQYDHSIRVPLMMAGPGIPVGERRDTYAYLLDVYPTLCELLELPTPESVEGTSLVPAFHDKRIRIRETIFAGFAEYQRSVKDDRYKLIEYAAGGSRNTQLFDLHEDPQELHNLAEDSQYAERVADLQALMMRYRDEWGDRDTRWGRIFWDHYEGLS